MYDGKRFRYTQIHIEAMSTRLGLICMDVMIASYINHANEVDKIIKEVVEKGAGDIFMNAITRQFDVPLSMLQANVSNLLYTNQNQS